MGRDSSSGQSAGRVTLAELVADLERRLADAERVGSTALLSSVLRMVLADLRAVDDVSAAEPGDRLMKVDETAAMLGVSSWWIYVHAKTLPFARKIGPKALRFSEKGARRWLLRRVA